jgi:hypothetical protein
MDQSLRHTAPTATVLAWIALGVLAVITFLGGVVVIVAAPSLTHQYPEFAHLEIPLAGAALGVLACIEVVLGLIALLIRAIHNGQIFEEFSLKLVDALIGACIVATVICAIGWVLIPGPPPLGLVVIGVVFAGISLVFVLIVLRSLLRQASSMRIDLDRVI